jgi:hypothetical protein
LVSAVLDSVLGVMLLFIAVSIGLGSIVGSIYINLAVSPQAGTMLGNTVARSLLLYLSNASDVVPADSLMMLADDSPWPCSFPALRNQLGFGNLSFRVDLSAPLDVKAGATSSGLVVSVTKSGRMDPVEAFLHLYVLDMSSQTILAFSGETNVDGSAFFSVTFTMSEVGVLFAKAGASTGYAVFSSQGTTLPRGILYVKDGRLRGGNQTSVYVLGFEDWVGPVTPGGSVDVTGYSLPVVLVYQDFGGVSHYSTYPWLGGCGPTPVQAAGSYFSDQTFVVRVQGGNVILIRLRVWGPGGK